MCNSEITRLESRAIISNTCRILVEAQHRALESDREVYASSADCFVLLQDATKLFCRAVSESYGECERDRRWSPALPELLLAHPERCDETLALLEQPEFQEITYFQFVHL